MNDSKRENYKNNNQGNKEEKNQSSPGVYEIKIDEKKILKQHKITINDIDVYFPYKPYNVQTNYMKSVIDSLNGKKNALLQSPTGTGKTLCLLCASLAWLHKKRLDQIKNKEDDPVRIIYSSRTHSQLQQVIKELKKTVYKPTSSILASRDQYCIKPDFSYLKGHALISNCLKACKQKDADNKCNFFQGQHGDFKEQFTGEIQDIEELKATGLNKGFCPYFHSRRMKDVCDILLLPYNYLLDLSSFPVFSIEIKNCIVIFDEAHNVQSVSEDGASFQLPLATVDETEKELNILEDYILKEQKDPNRTTAQFKKKMENVSEIDTQGLKTSSAKIENVKIPLNSLRQNMFNMMTDDKQLKRYSQTEHGMLAEGRQIFDLFQKITKYTPQQENNKLTNKNMQFFQKKQKKPNKFDVGINIGNYEEYLEIITGMISDLSTTQNWGLDGLKAFITGIFSLLRKDVECTTDKKSWSENSINHYKMYFKVDKENDTCIFHLWCMDPSLSFQKLLEFNPLNIILTSGTMIPFKPWEAELKMEFGIKLENGHVIDHKKNLLAGVVKRGPANHQLCFDYQNRDNENMINDLGMTLINLSRFIPNGILVIFSSYSVLAKCKDVWYNHSFQIMKRLSEIKDVIFEPRTTGNMQDTMIKYQKACKTKRGAVLMAVCRGKISEGIDFTDELARAVFIVGVPYPPKAERKVEVKQDYLDTICKRTDIINDQKLTGSEWYQLQAVRAYNQAIGRVIRHKDDWGAVFFCDCRYDGNQMKSQMSEWMLRDLQIWQKFGEGIKSAIKFYNDRQEIIKQNTPLELQEANSILHEENSQSQKQWDSSNLQAKPSSKRKQDINFSTYLKNTHNTSNNFTSKISNSSNFNLSQTLDKNLQNNNNKKPLILRNYSNNNYNMNKNIKVQLPQQLQLGCKIQETSDNQDINNNNYNNYDKIEQNNSINQYQGVKEPKGLASIFLKNPKYQKNLKQQKDEKNDNIKIHQQTPQNKQNVAQNSNQTFQSGGLLNKLKQKPQINKSLSLKRQQNNNNFNFSFTEVIEQNTQNFEDQLINNDKINRNQFTNINNNQILNENNSQKNDNLENDKENIKNENGKLVNSKQSTVINFDQKMEQFKFKQENKIIKQQKSIKESLQNQKQKQVQQQNNNKNYNQQLEEEIDDSRCYICQRKKIVQPFIHRICNHVACQRCWAQQLDQNLFCICKTKINRSYLVDYKKINDK